MFHPVYLSENPSKAFNVVPPKVSGPKDVAGPVYLTENARHKYAEFIMQVKGLKNIAGPVYLSDNNSTIMISSRNIFHH